MPKYYFDLEDGDRQFDKVGAILENDGAAKQEASLRALNGLAHQLSHYKGKARIVVRNQNGEDIHAVRIARGSKGR